MTHEFDNLPPLTDDEAKAVGAFLIADGRLADVADVLDIKPARLLDLLASPNVQAHIDHARDVTRRRTERRLAEAAVTAIEVLEEIAHDAEAERVERRRAATTLLNAFAPRRARKRPVDVQSITDVVDRLTDPHARANQSSVRAPGASTGPIQPQPHTPSVRAPGAGTGPIRPEPHAPSVRASGASTRPLRPAPSSITPPSGARMHPTSDHDHPTSNHHTDRPP